MKIAHLPHTAKLRGMKPRAFFFAILSAIIVTLTPTHAADIAPAEKAKIEALIANVGALPDAKFIRNGSTYDAKSAVSFLRGKWKSNDSDITTAADFIAKAASVSGTSGKPYLIKLKDGSEVKCGDYLTEQLKKLEEKK